MIIYKGQDTHPVHPKEKGGMVRYPPNYYRFLLDKDWMIAVFAAMAPLNREIQREIIDRYIHLQYGNIGLQVYESDEETIIQEYEEQEKWDDTVTKEKYLDLEHDLDKIDYEIARIKRSCFNV